MTNKPTETNGARNETTARRRYSKPRLEVAPLTSVVRGTPVGSLPDVGPGRKTS